MFCKEIRRWRFTGNAASWRDVVGGDGVTAQHQHSSTLHRLDRSGLGRQVLEEGGLLNVSTLVVPVEDGTLGAGNFVPLLIAAVDIGVLFLVHLRSQAGLQGVDDLLLGGPDIFEINWLKALTVQITEFFIVKFSPLFIFGK